MDNSYLRSFSTWSVIFFLFDRRFSVVAANPFFLFLLLSFVYASFLSLNIGYVVPTVVPVQEATCDHIWLVEILSLLSYVGI